MTFFFQGLTEAPPTVTYLLSANFNAANQSFVDGQTLDTPAEGVQQGSFLSVIKDTAQIGINANELEIVGSSNWTESYLRSTSDFVRNFGLCYLGSIRASNSTDGISFGWIRTNLARVNDGRPGLGRGNANTKWRFSWNSNSYLDLVDVMASAIDYRIACLMGGYDDNGLPYKLGDTKANFISGGAAFVKGGAYTNWTLMYRRSGESSVQPYAVSGVFIGTHHFDDLAVPDEDVGSILEPTVLDTFTGANGTLISSRSPDVGAGNWTNDGWTIQSNRAQHTVASRTAIDSSKADVFVEAIFNMPAASEGGLVLRYTDTDNCWLIKLNVNTGLFQLIERNAGVETQRASRTRTIAANTDYRCVAICDDEQIDCYLGDSSASISYASAAFNKSATQHGLCHALGTVNVDNFAVYPRGTEGEYAALDNYPGEGN